MGTPFVPTTTPAAPVTPKGIGAEIKAFFGKLGHDLSVIGTDALKALGVIEKDVSVYTPLVSATIDAMFPGVALPVQSVTKIITASLNTAGVVATALQAQGLNPTLNQAAAIAIATQVHLTGATTAQVTAAVASGTALADTVAGVVPKPAS